MRLWPAICLAGLTLSGCGPAAAPDAQSDTASATPAAQTTAPQTPPPADQSITPTVQLGEMLFRRCAACHTVEAGGAHGIGPNLHGVIGRKVGGLADFRYSRAMQNHAGQWDEATLDAFLAEPMKNIPGNRMVFGGVIEAADRKALYLFLKQAK